MGLLVVALLVIPSFINWNTYKSEIADQVRALTGRELIIGGDIDLKIFPSPRLVAENVSLSSIEGAQSPDLVSLRSVEVRIALAPLLGGNIGIETVQLIEPQVFLEVLADGHLRAPQETLEALSVAPFRSQYFHPTKVLRQCEPQPNATKLNQEIVRLRYYSGKRSQQLGAAREISSGRYHHQ